jgi:hypothetical protein
MIQSCSSNFGGELIPLTLYPTPTLFPSLVLKGDLLQVVLFSGKLRAFISNQKAKGIIYQEKDRSQRLG